MSKRKAVIIINDNRETYERRQNLYLKYRSISSSFTSDIPSFVFVCAQKGPAYIHTIVTQCRYLIYGMQQNVTKCAGM